MSYCIVDINGYVDELATNKGYDELSQWVNENTLVNGKEFIEKGYTNFLLALKDEILLGLRYGKRPSFQVKKTIDQFLKNIDRCKEIIIIEH